MKSYRMLPEEQKVTAVSFVCCFVWQLTFIPKCIISGSSFMAKRHLHFKSSTSLLESETKPWSYFAKHEVMLAPDWKASGRYHREDGPHQKMIALWDISDPQEWNTFSFKVYCKTTSFPTPLCRQSITLPQLNQNLQCNWCQLLLLMFID